MIKNIAVIGAGTMGRGIASYFAMHGCEVHLYDQSEVVRKNTLDEIEKNSQFMINHKLSQINQVSKILSKIKLFSNLELAVKNADYVIESILEDVKLKNELFIKLDSMCPEHTIFATNTSSLSLGEIISGLSDSRKSRALVSHWYNPSYLMPLVEVSYFGNTLESVSKEVFDFYVSIGKKPVKILKDVPGMLANRLLHALAREAFSLIENGVATAEDIDSALKFGPAFRAAATGMLEVADIGGLDIWLIAGDNIFPHLENSNKASDMLRQKVKDGMLGIKSGEGFYKYPSETKNTALQEFNKRLALQLAVSENY